MKVLKKGRDVKGWSAELKCTGHGNGEGGCGSILLVEHSDLFETGRHCYDGSSDYFITFRCPECLVMTDINGYRGPKVTRAGVGGRKIENG